MFSSNHVPEAVIVGFYLDLFGKYRGSLSDIEATKLGSLPINGLLDSLSVNPSGVIDGVYMGMVLQAGAGQAPARQASIGAGLIRHTCSYPQQGLWVIIEGCNDRCHGD